MASQVDKSTMTVIVREEVELNGTKFGSRTNFEIGSINEVSQRIVTVPTTPTTILNLSSSIGPGAYLTSAVKYVRLTNLDTQNYVRLTFLSGSANQFDVKLDALRTYIFTNASISGSNSSAAFDSFSSFTALRGTANSSSVDVELFVASS